MTLHELLKYLTEFKNFADEPKAQVNQTAWTAIVRVCEIKFFIVNILIHKI